VKLHYHDDTCTPTGNQPGGKKKKMFFSALAVSSAQHM